MTAFKHRPKSLSPTKSLGRDRSGAILAASKAFDASNRRRALEVIAGGPDKWGGASALVWIWAQNVLARLGNGEKGNE